MEKNLLHSKIEEIGYEIDRLTVEQKYGELETYIIQIETSSLTFDSSEEILLFYYIGTGKSTLASHFGEFKPSRKKSTAISYQKQFLFI